MLLKKITLKNVGVYRDKNEFDFSCSKEKPIILCGGTNGSGKTTLFESILLCLYGIKSFDRKISRKTYENFLARKIHRYLGTPISADFSSITLDFRFYHNDKVDDYSVTRMWQTNGGKVTEELSVQKNNEDLDTVEKNQWQPFIEELIPPGIAKLFFFDGEKIVRITEEDAQDIEIKSAFNTLLGLDLVEQLQSDLRVNLLRNVKGNSQEIQDTLDKFAKEKEESNDKIGFLREKQARINTEIDEINKNIANLETKISKMGGGYASQRVRLQERKSYLEMKISKMKNNIQNLCVGPLPFCLVPNQLEEVKNQLIKDEEILKKKFEKEILEKNFEGIKNEMTSENFWSDLQIDSYIKDRFTSKIFEAFNEKLKSKNNEDIPFVLNFSEKESMQLINLMDQINNDTPQLLENETKEFSKVFDELQKIEISLGNAPTDDEIGPIISKLNSLHTNLGTAQSEISHLEQKIGQERFLLKHLNAKLRTIVDEKYQTKNATNQVQFSQQVQKVLDEFSAKLKEKKLHMLENYLFEAIQTLMHKQYLIEKVSIDKDTFDVKLYRQNGVELPKSTLSAGEKQMFSTALLWALAKTSGKPLPFIIDTPLARLDEEHKSRVVEKFFPFASHQVIIFSTDTEIDEANYAKLLPYISRNYALEYVPVKGKSRIREGYFWGETVTE